MENVLLDDLMLMLCVVPWLLSPWRCAHLLVEACITEIVVFVVKDSPEQMAVTPPSVLSTADVQWVACDLHSLNCLGSQLHRGQPAGVERA